MYRHGDAELGPIPRSALEALASSGGIGAGTLVRKKGSATWMRFAETVTTPPAFSLEPAGEKRTCSRCGGAFAPEALLTYQGAYFCAACKRDYFQHLAQGTLMEANTPPHALAKRALAKAVDVNLLLTLYTSLCAFLRLLVPDSDADLSDTVAAYAVFAFFLAGVTITTARYEGTPGKLLFRLRVTDTGGARLGYGRALVRAVAELASVACAGLGYFVTGKGGERRTLHDRIAGTRVVQQEGGWPWEL